MGLYHTGQVQGLPVTFKSTMAEFRAARAKHPEFPRFLILANTLQEAELMAARIWDGCGQFHTTARGRGSDRISIVTGVAPVPLTARQCEQERRRREARRGHAALPCGGLWDETSINKKDLF